MSLELNSMSSSSSIMCDLCRKKVSFFNTNFVSKMNNLKDKGWSIVKSDSIITHKCTKCIGVFKC